MPTAAPPSDPRDDPRLDPEYVRELPGVVLVGVVHDHPASVYRARAVVAARDPDVVALELPELAVPLYRTYAEDSQTPPVFGGEMSAAIQASAPGARVVGIDAPNFGFVRSLARTLVSERASVETTRRLLDGLLAVSRQAALCRAAAVIARRTSVTVGVDAPRSYSCAPTDPPEVQADDERRQVARSRALLRAADAPESVTLRDAVREACMARRLAALGRYGTVVAVVGLDHLEPLFDRLRRRSSES